MSLDRIDLLVGAACIIVFIAGVFGVRKFGEWQFVDIVTEKEISLVSCVENKWMLSCARPIITDLLEHVTGADIMNLLSKNTSAQQCHYLGHVVGKESYVHYQSIEGALAQCNRSCDSACFHGIVGEAFAQKIGSEDTENNTPSDFQHLKEDELRKIGLQLCTSPDACHGVGHALFQIYLEFAPSLKMCREISTKETKIYCYQGVFMEYADILTDRNMDPSSDVSAPQSEDVDVLCDNFSLEERRACFRYFPRIFIFVHEQGGFSPAQAMTRLRNLCLSYADVENRVACVYGIGVSSSYTLMANVERAVNQCRDFSEKIDQAACNFGQVSVSAQERRFQIAAYCAELTEDDFQESCYQALFYHLHRLGTSSNEMQAICRNNEHCIRGAQNFELSPWEQIQKGFVH